MSENMAQGAIIEVVNYLFGRKKHGKLKPYKSGEPNDCNTLPSPSNTNKTLQSNTNMLLFFGPSHG